MVKRRKFNQSLGALLGLSALTSCNQDQVINNSITNKGPIILSTWNNSKANEVAMSHLKNKPLELLNAIEKGVNHVESDPNDTSVGFGGLPDNEGNITLDACIMNHKGQAGSVTYLQGIKHPVSVARKVMEKTPHVILSGKGAQDFAVKMGYEIEDLSTPKSLEAYQNWLKEKKFQPEINSERHDTIGMIGINNAGDLSGACSTSGLSFKMPGRVGDSPIIGAGLFVDDEIGCAVATGLGELVLKTCSTFLVVELMRSGLSPQKACEKAIERIINKVDSKDAQVGLIALSKSGETGGFSIHKGFNYAVTDQIETNLIEAGSYYN